MDGSEEGSVGLSVELLMQSLRMPGVVCIRCDKSSSDETRPISELCGFDTARMFSGVPKSHFFI